jgi:hypothetical protein
MDPDQMIKEVVRTAIPNVPFSKAVENVLIEGMTDG